MFCTYKHDSYSLDLVSDKYIDEFLDNTSWLKFGFHCYDELDQYEKVDGKTFNQMLNMFFRTIEFTTGQKSMPDKLRVHGFQGNEEVCKILYSKGVKTLFSSDDKRKNYYLDESTNAELFNTGSFYDSKNDISFYKSCTRLENSDDIEREIWDCVKKRMRIIPVFTHEWQMDKGEIREKFELCCRIGSELR